MVNRITRDVLLAIIAEWLEEWEMPSLVLRNQQAIEPADLKRKGLIKGSKRSSHAELTYTG